MKVIVLLLLASIATAASADQPRFAAGHVDDERVAVKEGHTVKFTCRVDNLGNNAVSWLRSNGKDMETIFIDDAYMGRDERFSLDYDPEAGKFDLRIERVDVYDNGVYECRVLSEVVISRVHRLTVKVPPSLSIVPELSPLIVRPNEPFQLRCTGAGSPAPTIRWRKLEEAAPRLLATSDGLHFVARASAEDSGVYVCEARNSEGVTTDEVVVKVQTQDIANEIKPELRIGSDYIPAVTNTSVNISCFYRAEPEPSVEWLFNGFELQLKNDPRKTVYQARHENETEVILGLSNLSRNDFGVYTCRVDNYMGSGIAEVKVDSRPGPPKVDIANEHGAIRLSVAVASPMEVLQYEVSYASQEHDDTWISEKFKPQKRQRSVAAVAEPTFRAEYTLERTAPKTEYRIRVRAQNADGWGHMRETRAATGLRNKITRTFDKGDNTSTATTNASVFALLLTALAAIAVASR